MYDSFCFYIRIPDFFLRGACSMPRLAGGEHHLSVMHISMSPSLAKAIDKPKWKMFGVGPVTPGFI